MEQMSKVLVLTFKHGNGTMGLTITKPSDALTGTQIKAAADAIVATNALGKDVQVKGIQGAQYVSRLKNAVDLEG